MGPMDDDWVEREQRAGEAFAQGVAVRALTFVEKVGRVMEVARYFNASDKNIAQKYTFAPSSEIFFRINKALVDQGLVLDHDKSEIIKWESVNTESPDGRTRTCVQVLLRRSFLITDGDNTLRMEGFGEGRDYGDKATAKAQTSAMRYALAGTLLISWGDDIEKDSECFKALRMMFQEAMMPPGNVPAIRRIRAKVVASVLMADERVPLLAEIDRVLSRAKKVDSKEPK